MRLCNSKESSRSKAAQLDCPGFGPGPHGPGSECPGQREVGPDPILKVQVQLVNGPDLGVGPGSDLNRTSIYASSVNMYYILSIEKNICIFYLSFSGNVGVLNYTLAGSPLSFRLTHTTTTTAAGR